MDMAVQDLYRGESIGEPYQVPLEVARLHYFGGTTGHWAGWCTPLDPIDFEKRDWVPHSGWPITREDLDPFYARAQSYVELGPFEYDVDHYERQDPTRKRLPLDADLVWTKMWQFSPPTRFGTRYREALVEAPNVHLYTYANVTEIEANEPARAVNDLRAKTIDGKEHRVRARYYVLACGALQNARLLLASNHQAPAGLGNDNDLVGRFFMEHFEMGSAQLMLAEPSTLPLYTSRFRGQLKPSGELALTARAQQQQRILNGTASLRSGIFGEELTSFFQNFQRGVYRRRNSEQEGDEDDRPNWPTPSPEGQQAYQMHSRAEQAPNPASRVVLGAEKDALGMPRAQLDWRMTELDKRSMRVFYEVLGQEIGRSELGRVQLLDWLLEDDPVWPSFLGGGFHHMGTTRMHDDPKQGVVDPTCKVHSIDNLYAAGSSTFTTAGAANPTLTLIAVSLRLSDHLKTRIG